MTRQRFLSRWFSPTVVSVLLFTSGTSWATGWDLDFSPPSGSEYYGYKGYSGGLTIRHAPRYYYSPVAPDVSPEYITAPTSDLLLHVHVPADARVWINGNPTTRTGEYRDYISIAPILGQRYAFEIRAAWIGNGKIVEKTEIVQLMGGERRVVDFLASRP